MNDNIEFIVKPVYTQAIGMVTKTYQETLKTINMFKNDHPDFEDNVMSFFSNPSKLEEVYNMTPTDDLSIIRGREILEYWRKQKDSNKRHYDFFDYSDEKKLVDDCLTKMFSKMRPNEEKRLLQDLDFLLSQMDSYLKTFGVFNASLTDSQRKVSIFKDIQSRIDIIRNENSEYHRDYTHLLNATQARWARQDLEINANCEMWRIEVMHNGFPFGGIMVYHNDKYQYNGAKYILIQYIAMYPIPYLVKLVYPQLTIPKLNSLLNDPINRIGVETQSKYIVVHPLPKQGRILLQYYAYKEEREPVTLPGTSIEATHVSRSVLSKEVEY